jgi:hypothetical protein
MSERLGRPEEQPLSVRQAYLAMYKFLEDYQQRGSSDDIFMLLHAMRLTGDDETTDPGSWSDWLRSVEEAKRDEQP